MNRLQFVGASILILLAGVSASWAQEGNSGQPAGPYPPLYQQSEDSSSKTREPNQEITVPDTHPLSGAQELTLGSSESSLNFLQPGLRFAQVVDSNSQLEEGGRGYQGISALSGFLELHRNSEHRELVLRYTGGGVFYSDNSAFNSSFHQFAISQTVGWRRWTLLLSDQVAYSPDSTFNGGYGGIPGLGNVGAFAGPTDLSPVFRPNQSVFTNNSVRVANTALGQVQYDLSPRSSITATGSYGILRFPDANLLDFDQTNARLGYNHSFSARDTVAVSYGFGLFRYEGVDQRFRTHSVELSYGRRLTGRLSLQLAGGPQITQSESAGLSDTRVFWAGRSSLNYRRGRTNFTLSFLHGVTGGAGVLLGSKTNEVQAGASRQMSRSWSVSSNFGFARNTGLRTANTFDSLYGGVGLRRALGRTAGMYFTYNVQRQDSSAFCSLPGCGSGLLRHIFGVGFEWQMRPIRLH